MPNFADVNLGDRIALIYRHEGVVIDKTPNWVLLTRGDSHQTGHHAGEDSGLISVDVIRSAKRKPKVGDVLNSEHELADGMILRCNFGAGVPLWREAGKWHSPSGMSFTDGELLVPGRRSYVFLYVPEDSE